MVLGYFSMKRFSMKRMRLGESMNMAREYAEKYHDGQYRKGGNLPYISHPENVVRFLKSLGYDDDVTTAVGWLHDTIEDTSLTYEKIREVFGLEIAEGVMYLTRDVNNDEYKKRLVNAPERIKMVKLADTLHNIQTLDYLSAQGIERKVNDCFAYYIPMAKEIYPPIADMMLYPFKRFGYDMAYNL